MRLRHLVGSVFLALTFSVKCEAAVLAVSNDGSFVPVATFDAPQKLKLVAFREPIPAAIEPHVVTPLVPASIPRPFVAAATSAASANDVSPELLAAVVWQESRWHPDAISPVGALGLGQLMPSTAREMRINPRDPVANLYGAAHYLREQIDRFNGNIELALAAYNAGPARVRKAGRIPNIVETRNYVTAIMARLSTMSAKED